MERTVFRYALGGIVCALVLVSCPSPGSRGGAGVIRVSLASASSRSILDAPVFPVFSSAKVTVTGDGMSPITATITNGSVSINVTAGERVVTVDAVPDWAATVAASPSTVPVTNATRYGGTATVEVESGRTADVPISLTVTETQIALMSEQANILFFARTFAEVATAVNDFGTVNISHEMDFEPDQYGRIYVADQEDDYSSSSIARYDGGGGANPVVPNITVATEPITRIALDATLGRIYYVGYIPAMDDVGPPSGYFEAATGLHVYFNQPTNLPGNFDIHQPGLSFLPAVAVDADGVAIMPLFDRGPDDMYTGDETYYLAKAAAGSAYYLSGVYVADPTILTLIPYAAVGMTDGSGNPLVVYDMVVVGDTVYLLLDDVDHTSRTRSRGKILALRTADLGNPRSAGWSDSAFPLSPQAQFYGPARFIGMAPGKLYVADDGYSSPTSNANRVVEVTLEPLSISGVSAVPAGVTFFNEY